MGVNCYILDKCNALWGEPELNVIRSMFPFSKGETMRMASLSENNLWSAFSETGQLSVTSTADLHSPSSTICDMLNVMHVRMASLSEDNLWSAFWPLFSSAVCDINC